MAGVAEKIQYIIQPIERALTEHGIVLFVPELFINPSLSIPHLTTLDAFITLLPEPDFHANDAQTKGYGSYVFTECIGRERGCLKFVFHKPKVTKNERFTLIRPATWTRRPFEWPDVLKSLWGLKGREISYYSNNLTDAYYDRYILVKGGRYQTDIKEEEYFSSSPFLPKELTATELRPMPVFYKYKMMENSFLCLHKTIRVPELFVGGTLLPEFGYINEAEQNWTFGAKFEATNYIDWAPHCISSTPIERDGGFYLKVETAIPPFSTSKIYS